MTMKTEGPRHLRRRGLGACDGRGRGRGPGRGVGEDDSSPAAWTAVRAVVAAGACVAQDVRDRDGLTRPMLRRAALRMAACRQEALRRAGAAYLRADPPALEELPSRAGLLPAGIGPVAPLVPGDRVIDVDPATIVEDEGPQASAV